MWEKITGIVHGVMVPCVKKTHCVYRVVHTTGHGSYFIAAAAESHGFYSKCSIFLLGVMVIGLILREEDV